MGVRSKFSTRRRETHALGVRVGRYTTLQERPRGGSEGRLVLTWQKTGYPVVETWAVVCRVWYAECV